MRRRNQAGTALLLVDFLHVLVAESGPSLGPAAVKAARYAALLKQKAHRARVPVIYANDHFGNWRSDFPSLVRACKERKGCAAQLAAMLEPAVDDFSILKPRHSAFYGTPLDFLLDELRVNRLILAGIEADICLMYTAQDAYMRRYQLWIPRNCTASRSAPRLTAALMFMKTNLKADTSPATSSRMLRATSARDGRG